MSHPLSQIVFVPDNKVCPTPEQPDTPETNGWTHAEQHDARTRDGDHG